MQKMKLPLLEYDPERQAVFSPADYIEANGMPEKCVVAFSYREVEEVAARRKARKVGTQNNCTAFLPEYIVEEGGEEIGLVCGFLGGAGAAAQMEELIYQGARKIVVCGAAGSLLEAPLGAIILLDCAVRDEGTSFHYLPPSREVQADEEALRSVQRTLAREGVPCRVGKTWTTDGLYRETPQKVVLRRNEGCIVVEMEAAALMSVARFRGATLGYLLYCGDDMSGEVYDHRSYFQKKDMRVRLVELAIRCCKDL